MKNAPLCRVCGRPMTLIKNKMRIHDGYCFRCPRHKHVRMSIRVNSILYEKHIALSTFILMSYFWSLQIPVTYASKIAEVSLRTVISWYQTFRCICSKWIAENPIRIGGLNRSVQVDKTVIARKRINGELVPTQWIFGGIDTETKSCFLVRIRSCSTKKLMNLIETYIDPGSKILSFEVIDFSEVVSLPVKPGFTHENMSSRASFSVNPGTAGKDHLQNIEGLWVQLKGKFTKMGGVHSDSIESYLEEYMWRQMRGRTPTDAYNSIFEDIAHFFPL